MDYQKIVEEKGGEVVEEGASIFDQHRLICKEGHFFNLYANDILSGEWCGRCQKEMEKSNKPDDSKIGDILRELSIPYEYREVIGEIECDYIIKEGRKFIILTNPSSSLLEEIGEGRKIEGWNLILITDLSTLVDLSGKKDIWEAIKNNVELTYIPPLPKPSENKGIVSSKLDPKIVEHGCEIEEKIYQCGKSEVCSVVKEAYKPYPTDHNHAVAYIRVSTQEQVKDGFSLYAQERNMFEEAKKRNLFLKRIYIDKGISGGSTEKRAGLAKMRDDLVEGDWVLSCYISRVSRKTKDLLTIVDEIKEKGCHFIVREMDVDFTSPQGQMILALMGSHAQFERDQTSERVKTVITHLKKTGQFRSKPYFGWKMNSDRSPEASIHIRDEEEMKTIKRIRQIRNKFPDLGKTAFARKLNDLKVPPPRGAKCWYHKFTGDLMEREGMKFTPPRGKKDKKL
jgi:DNA invertase Pin-like site-specific DNA recombinase